MQADVCLIVEGGYPYSVNGASVWIHNLVQELREVRFTLLSISPDPEPGERKPIFRLPANVTLGPVATLYGQDTAPTLGSKQMSKWMVVHEELSRALVNKDETMFQRSMIAAQRIAPQGVSETSVLRHPHYWRTLVKHYERQSSGDSFVDFYRTWSLASVPMLRLCQVAIPKARTYHALTSGYAGLLAVRAGALNNRPVLVTRQGAFGRRESLDLMRWSGRPELRTRFSRTLGRRLAESMEGIACRSAAEVLAIEHSTQDMDQGLTGIGPRVRSVPGGINVAEFKSRLAAAEVKPRGSSFTVGFLGRVSPDKDVKTLLRATNLLRRQILDLRVRILGLTDDDPGYAKACRKFSEDLGLSSVVSFEDRVDVASELQRMDAVVLTSVSEGLPRVILEAGLAGIPVVSTDVGACRDLLVGRTPEDRALGVGGLLTPIGSPAATANALEQFYRNPVERQEMGAVLRERVSRYYRQGRVVDAYRRIYQLQWGAA